MNDDLPLAVFEPQVILPEQVASAVRDDAGTSGPRALMLAILQDAMQCIVRGRCRRHAGTRRLAAEAETWVRSDCHDWLFSFASICDVLGFDAEALRLRLLTNAVHPVNRETGADFGVYAHSRAA